MQKEITSPDIYAELAMRTLAYSDEYPIVLHALMGMTGEAGELQQVLQSKDHPLKETMIIDELGDCFWYSAAMAFSLGRNFSSVMVKAMTMLDNGDISEEATLLGVTAVLQDIVKKHLFYKKELSVELVEHNLAQYIGLLVTLSTKLGITIPVIFTRNITKLEARYPDKMFVHEHAINVDKTAEAIAVFASILGSDS